MTELEKGKEAECNRCGYTAVIQHPVISVLGGHIGYGPGGPEDQFVENPTEGVVCYDCVVESIETE